MVKIENITKNYGQIKALDNISFEVKDGEVLGFLGLNGAGKTTTMNIITGFIPPTSGTVIVNNTDIMEEPKKVKSQIGYLPEQPPLYMDMTVSEYLKFVAGLKKIAPAMIKQNVEKAIESVKINDVAGRIIANLSKGYKQRVGFAQALIGNPEILIFDEPTIGLDPTQVIEIRKLISELQKKHTIIFSSHILSEVSAVANRIVIIDKGKIIAEGDTKSLSRSFGGNDLEISVLGPKQAVMAAIRSVSGVKSVEHISTRNDLNSFEIEHDENIDIRKALFFELAKQSFPIYELKTLYGNLEEIFLGIVKHGGLKVRRRR